MNTHKLTRVVRLAKVAHGYEEDPEGTLVVEAGTPVEFKRESMAPGCVVVVIGGRFARVRETALQRL